MSDIEATVIVDHLFNKATGKHAWTSGDGVFHGPFNTRREAERDIERWLKKTYGDFPIEDGMSDQQPHDEEWICAVCGELMGADEEYEDICDECAAENKEEGGRAA